MNAAGVSIDYEQYVRSWDEAFCALEDESQQTLVEFSLYDVIDLFMDKHSSIGLSDDQRDEFIELFLAEWCAEIRPVQNIQEVLGRLSSRYKLGVVSNTHHKPLVPGLLDEFGLSVYFANVVISIDHGRPKPHESIYRYALSGLGSRPEQTVFVGDSYDHDYVAPRRLGIKSFLVSESPPGNVPKEHVFSRAIEVIDNVH